jgi:hypothetical protein
MSASATKDAAQKTCTSAQHYLPGSTGQATFIPVMKESFVPRAFQGAALVGAVLDSFGHIPMASQGCRI